MLTYPEIDPVIFAIGGLKIRWYGLMYVIGFAATWWLALRRSRQPWSPITRAQAEDLVFYGMVGVIVGGRVGYCLFYGFDQLISDPLYLFRITEGGMSFHGGLVGVIIAMLVFGRRIDRTVWQITDFLAPLVPIGLGAGRIGNFINGELWGKPTDLPWGFLVNGQVLHPSQLYEALLEGLALFLILWFYSARQRPYMAVSGLFLLCYGVFRFAVEFVRVPDAHLDYLMAGWVTMGQILSLPMILTGILMIWLGYTRYPVKGGSAGQKQKTSKGRRGR
jgi:phosphatidylglycerol:prolipoprotein diacylglycerol transferase